MASGFPIGASPGSPLMEESVSMDEFKMSPATDALEFLLSSSTSPPPVLAPPSEEQIDTSLLLVDLNELLHRDPNLSSLQDPSIDEIISLTSSASPLGVAIPKRNETLNSVNLFGNSLMVDPPSSISSLLSNPSWQHGNIKREYPTMESDMSLIMGNDASESGFQSEQLISDSTTEFKMETQDFDLDALFLSISSPNVSLGLGQSSRMKNSSTATTTSYTLKNMNFWQTDEFPLTDFVSPSTINIDDHKELLSSSVPLALTSGSQMSPLSDYLSDMSGTASAGPALSPSHAGPHRNLSTLHKLLMKKETMRPTADIRKNRISSQSSPLSQSAPSSDTSLVERMWIRREPRTHFTSECSVGDSSVTDEVNEIMAQMSPINQQDEEEGDDDDDFDEEDESKIDEKDSSDDSDVEGTSPFAGKSPGAKKERHFWQYNVQSKGPKGQKILIQTKIDDPHVLNEIVDPVFSGDVKLQGIKHSGKARRGDGNDLTANPRKLAAIGKELELLGREINDMTPLTEMPFGARSKSRKEKNKLASRACRLKKKAQHEANKLKLHGLQVEHRELVKTLDQARQILLSKVDPGCSKNQNDLTEQIDQLTKKALKNPVAGHTSEFVNKQIERNLPFV